LLVVTVVPDAPPAATVSDSVQNQRLPARSGTGVFPKAVVPFVLIHVIVEEAYGVISPQMVMNLLAWNHLLHHLEAAAASAEEIGDSPLLRLLLKRRSIA
jgi:hypothetical protein